MKFRPDEVVPTIVEAFRWWGTVPELCDAGSVNELVRMYEQGPGPTHYFDGDTRRFFGSSNPDVPAPGLYIETQRNAPDGMAKVTVTAFVWDTGSDGPPRLTPQLLGRFFDRRWARHFVRVASENWPAGQVTDHALVSHH